MKKRFLLIALLVCTLFLTACSGTTYESNDHNFTMKFPDEMLVVVPGQSLPEDPLLEELDINSETLEAYSAQGGIFYAVNKQDDVYTEITVNVAESDYTKEVWELKKDDTVTVTEFQDEIIETFNAGGIEVKQKGEFSQGRAFCVYVNACNNENSEIDSVYMATIYNGKQYSILYQSSIPLNEEGEQDAHDIFNTFYINKTLTNPNNEPRDTTQLQAILVIIILLIVAAVILLVVRMFGSSRRQKAKEEQPYVPQFEDTLKTTRKKDRKE